MCLKVVTGESTLKKDLKVWGIVRLRKGVEHAIFSDYKFDKRVNKSIAFRSYKRFCGRWAYSYKPGFHRFLTQKAAADFILHMRWLSYKPGREVILPFIIPAGEKVIKGIMYKNMARNLYCKVVVSQIIINPRITDDFRREDEEVHGKGFPLKEFLAKKKEKE